LSMFFLLTTAAGAALWAVDLERDQREREQRARSEQPPSQFYQGLDGNDGGEDEDEEAEV
ncbi:MAG: hypothetical protein M1823_005517, partial [Watsoniomyces obsoletus]